MRIIFTGLFLTWIYFSVNHIVIIRPSRNLTSDILFLPTRFLYFFILIIYYTKYYIKYDKFVKFVIKIPLKKEEKGR